MAIDLGVLALYALSSKMKGDRVRDQQEKQQEAASKTQYLVQGNDGVPRVVDQTYANLPDVKIIKIKPPGADAFIELPKEEKNSEMVPLYKTGSGVYTPRDWGTKISNREYGTFAEWQIKSGAEQVGYRTIKPDGTFTDDFSMYSTFKVQGTDKPQPTVEEEYSFVYEGIPYSTEGDITDVTNLLNENNIPKSAWKDIPFNYRQVKKDENGNVIDISGATSEYNLFGTPEEGPDAPEPITIKTPFYTTDLPTDDGKSFTIPQLKYDPKKHGNITGTFSQTKVDDTVTETTVISPIDSDKAAAALNESKMAYSIGVNAGDDLLKNESRIVFGSEASEPTQRLKTTLNQIANTNSATTWLEQNSNTNSVKNFLSSAFADAVASHEKIVVSDADYIQKGTILGRTLQQHVEMEFPLLLQLPGMKDLVTAYDEDLLDAHRNEKALENQDQNTDSAVAVVPVPNIIEDGTPANTLDPTAPDYVYKSLLVSWPKNYTPFISTNLIPVLNAANPTGIMVGQQRAKQEDLVSVALGSFINTEKTSDGRPLLDDKNNPVLSQDQPVLHTLTKMSKTPFGLSQNVTEFDAFIEFIDPRPGRLNEDAPEFKLIARSVFDMTNGDIRQTHGIVFNLIPSSAGAKNAMYEYFGFTGDKSRDKFIENQINVRDASRRALNITNSVIDTYYARNAEGQILTNPDGSIRLLDSASVGNLSLFVDGVTYLAGKGADLLNINFGDASSKDQMMAAVLGARNTLANNPAGFNTDDAGMKAIEAELEEISKINDAAYARRRFYTVVLAYEVSAAIQGGTGGKTISDQDVAMIMSGLKQEVTASPQTQLNALMGVREMLSIFEFRADMLSSNDPKKQYTYITAEKLLNMGSDGQFRTNFTIDGVYRAMGKSTATTPSSGASIIEQIITVNPDITQDTYNTFVLNNINSDLLYSGSTDQYSSLEDAKKALGDDLYKNLLDVANKNFVNKYAAGTQ